MSELWREVRTAARSLLQNPGYSLTAALTLAVGIGATTAIYTVVHNVLLEPLPFPDSERLVLIQEKNPEAGYPRFSLSPLNFRDYRDMSDSFEAMAAQTGSSVALAGQDGSLARRLRGRSVTADYLKVMGMPPAQGRDFTAEDDTPGAPRVVILTHPLWQDLGGTSDILNSDLQIDGETAKVIGILPPEFPPPAEILVPLALPYESIGRGAHFLMAVGRLKDGVDIGTARSELEKVAANLEENYPDSNTGWGAIVDPLHNRVVENVETALWVLLGAVAAVLLIACTNVANLTLARLATRERELALRSALGAGRFRLLRSQLVESTLLSLVGGAFGLVLARYATNWLVAMNADSIPRSHAIAIDSQVVIFALAITLGTALLFGALPAWRATRLNLTQSLKDGGRGQAGDRKQLRLRSSLVFAEVALAIVLLVGAGLLMRSFAKLVDVDPGFEPEQVWTAAVNLPDSYEENEQRLNFFNRLLNEAAAIPGVEGAATVMPMPLTGNDYILTMYIEGEPLPEANKEHRANIRFISPGYFDVLGIPILKGRDLNDSDTADTTPVILVNKSAAERFWPDRDPLKERISFGRPDRENVRWFDIVGIVDDVHHSALEETPRPAFYRASFQGPPSFSTIVLKTAGAPETAAAGLRQLTHRLDPNLPLFSEQTAADIVAGSVAEPRFNMTLLSLFGAVALLLAAIGVFGVVSYAVTQRQKELGVRIALGARASEIVGLVVGQGMKPVLFGAGLGLLGALAASRLVASLIYGVSMNDPLTYAMVGGLLAAIAVLACLVPALRATRIDPIRVLRDE